MKKILSFILVVMSSYLMAQTNSITGTVTYYNVQNTLIHDSAVVYLYQGQTPVYQDTIHADGSFLFENIAPGTYILQVKCSKVWGGGNTADCLKMLKHFVQMPPFLTGLFLTVSDVNCSGGITGSADRLAVLRRFVGMIDSFMPPNMPPPGGPDWYSENFTLTIDGTSNILQNIRMLCAGDVNGSYIPF